MLFISSVMSAQDKIEIKLWEKEKCPNTNNMTEQVEGGALYVEEPTLTIYPPPGQATIAIPFPFFAG